MKTKLFEKTEKLMKGEEFSRRNLSKKEKKIKIPKQLQNLEFRFILLSKKLKSPYEKGERKYYKYNDEVLLSHIKNEYNYGVNGGDGNLKILDIDDKELAEEMLKKLNTFCIKTCGGTYHFYFITDYDTNHVFIDNKGEFRAKNYYVVGPNCYAIDTKKGHEGPYTVEKDLEIQKISKEEITKIISPYLREKFDSEKIEEKPKDKSRSGLEYRRIIALLREGKTKEEIFQEMTAYSKWQEAPEQYREYTYNKAAVFVKLEDSKKEGDDAKIKRERLLLPKRGKLISTFAQELVNIIKDKNILFFRPESREIIEIGKIKEDEKIDEYVGFISMNNKRFVTLIEKYVEPGIKVAVEKGYEIVLVFKSKSIGSDLASILLESHILQEALPKIVRIFNVPIPIMYEGKLTFPKRGYDKRFKSWLSYDAPEIKNPDMKLEEAKKILHDLFSEFCFQDKQDYINTIAALLTPYLRGLFSNLNVRTPLWIYLANRERVGKDYLAGITGILYEGYALEDPPISMGSKQNNTEELKKKILSAMISGRKRLHFSNNKGYINNSVLEAVLSLRKYSDRVLGKNQILTFDNEIDYSLSGNIGITFTPDLANRSRFIKLFLDIEDVNSRVFKNTYLHEWVISNRGLILSALYSLISNWIDKGSPEGKVPFASYPEWSKICGGIMEAAGYNSPCVIDKEGLLIGGDVETQDMKKLFELCYEKFSNRWLSKTEIREFVKETKDLFSYYDFDKRSDQIKFGNKLTGYTGRMLSNIRLIVKDKSIRSSRQELKFTKEKVEHDKTLIFGKNSEKTAKSKKYNRKLNTSGNHGNLGNQLY